MQKIHRELCSCCRYVRSRVRYMMSFQHLMMKDLEGAETAIDQAIELFNDPGPRESRVNLLMNKLPYVKLLLTRSVVVCRAPFSCAWQPAPILACSQRSSRTLL